MEEILASIRRIISEDDPPAEAATASAAPVSAAPVSADSAHPAAAPPPAPPAPVIHTPEPPSHSPFDEDVLELTDPVQPEPAPLHAASAYEETVGDLDVFSSAPAASTFAAPAPSFPAEPLTGSYAAETSAGHFGALARSVAMPKDGRSLEDVVRELLKPLLRDWLDQHLPAIVEARVQAEVERIARRNEY